MPQAGHIPTVHVASGPKTQEELLLTPKALPSTAQIGGGLWDQRTDCFDCVTNSLLLPMLSSVSRLCCCSFKTVVKAFSPFQAQHQQLVFQEDLSDL